MATAIKSQQELYDIFTTNMQDAAPDITDLNEGSIADSVGGATSLVAVELQKLIVDRFAKTFFATAHGPEVTGGPDDLQTLAVDHFGDDFARPGATSSSGTITFSRPTTGAGNILIPAGTVVKTQPDANGSTQRFQTLLDVTLTGLTINASVTAFVAGSAGNAQAGTVTVTESSLLDQTITVTNSLAFTGGAPAQDDAAYRETIRNKILALLGATLPAIESKALGVSGVEMATGIESLQAVIPYDIATGLPVPGAQWFRIPNAILYIADANGTASSTLIASVVAAVAAVRAMGVKVDVQGASPLTINWTAALTLNPAGPNYTTLASDTSMIRSSMQQYITALPIGTSFTRTLADAAILAIWGPSGTGDLTANGFQTVVPTANVAAIATQKLVPGTMATQ